MTAEPKTLRPRKAYAEHIRLHSNMMAKEINYIRNKHRKSDGSRYSYTEAGLLVKTAMKRAVDSQPQQQ